MQLDEMRALNCRRSEKLSKEARRKIDMQFNDLADKLF